MTVQCFTQSGCDAELTPWPLFGFMEYGQDRPPTYVYPGILWAKIFGSTVPSLRGYSVFVLLIGILGLFFLGKQLFGEAFAVVVVLAATCSPWAWVVTRVAFVYYFAPTFAIWGLYFFWHSNRCWDWALGRGHVCLCHVFLSACQDANTFNDGDVLGCYEWGKRTLRWQSVLSMLMVFILLLLPMACKKYKDGKSLARRFNAISIFNTDYLHSLGKNRDPMGYRWYFYP